MEKWAKSFYDKQKAEKIIEYLEEKGRSLNSKSVKPVVPQKLQRMNLQGDRKTFIDWIKRYEEKKYLQYPEREDKIQEIKDNIIEYNKNKKSPIQQLLEKYRTKGGLPKCDRITIVSDAEYVGEILPFCNELKKEEDDMESEKRKKKFKNKTTYPSVKFFV